MTNEARYAEALRRRRLVLSQAPLNVEDAAIDGVSSNSPTGGPAASAPKLAR